MLGWLENYSSIGPARVHAHWDFFTRRSMRLKGPKNQTKQNKIKYKSQFRCQMRKATSSVPSP